MTKVGEFMKWIGLTGGIATGKSSVAKYLRDLGLAVVDADVLAREVTQIGSAGLIEVVREFGKEILNNDASLDRKKLAQIIFNSDEKRLKLEKILHPLIQESRARERRSLENSGCSIAFYDVPLLFEKNMQSEFDETVLVYAPEHLQRERLRARNGLSDSEINMRLNAQMPIDEKVKLATHVIQNVSSLAELRSQVEKCVANL